MRLVKDESAQALVITALSISMLLAFVALAVDVGTLFHAKRNLQIVADAAASAGALDYYKMASSSSAIAAAQNAVKANGLTNATFNCPVAVTGSAPDACVTTPATSGSHTGTGTVEVKLVQPNPMSFMGLFGFNVLNVGVRAVAGSVAGQACIFVNHNYAVQGSATVEGYDPTTGTTGTACGIYVGGDVEDQGNGNTINAKYVEAHGTLVVNGQNNLNPTPVVTGAPEQDPPAALLAAPPVIPSTCSLPSGTTSSKSGQTTTYTVTLSGNQSAGCIGWQNPPANSILNVTYSNAAFGTGLYQFNLGTGGTLTLGSNNCNAGYCDGTIPPTGSQGVTLELNTGNFNVTSSGTQYLYAPSDGSTDSRNGILLWAPSSNTGTACIQFGSSTGNFYGYIDTPQMTVGLHDQGGFDIATGLIVGNLCQGNGINDPACKSFSCSGPSTLMIANYNMLYPGAPMRTITLVE
jgi:hypothetical protein